MQITPSQLIEAMEWRYSAKSFDPTRKLTAETWAALERALVLTASSYGLQPWCFYVIEDQATKEKLRPASWNQRQVTECSHFVVLAQKMSIDEAYVDQYLAAMSAVRNVPAESLAGLRKGIVGDVINGARAQYQAEWAARQIYIALGNLLTAAAVLGVDTCPMEGFEPAKYNDLLGLTAHGLSATVACAVGYRHPEDRFGAFKKVRFPRDQVVHRI